MVKKLQRKRGRKQNALFVHRTSKLQTKLRYSIEKKGHPSQNAPSPSLSSFYFYCKDEASYFTKVTRTCSPYVIVLAEYVLGGGGGGGWRSQIPSQYAPRRSSPVRHSFQFVPRRSRLRRNKFYTIVSNSIGRLSHHTIPYHTIPYHTIPWMYVNVARFMRRTKHIYLVYIISTRRHHFNRTKKMLGRSRFRFDI